MSQNKFSCIVFLLCSVFFLCISTRTFPQSRKAENSKNAVLKSSTLNITETEYEDRVHAIWIGQMAAAIMGLKFEHHTASVEWVDQLPTQLKSVFVDDDWYYEMAAIRAFEKHGINLTLQQLGQQWDENSCGTWGASQQSLRLIREGIAPPESGHPKHNKLWFSIGAQFSTDVYGALAPGMPNEAGRMAREYGHINSYAEGTDGGVFVAGMISIGFYEKDTKAVVRKAVKLISPESPYRKCIDLLIQLADEGKSAPEIFEAIEDRWHIEYPATNNAVPNGGIVAASVWFGEGDFLKTANLAFAAGDFTDADCNAANAVAVVGAMHGLKAVPEHLVKQFNDRITGTKMGDVLLTPAVDESISDLSKRTVAIGRKMLLKNGAKISGDLYTIPIQEVITQRPELFKLADLTKYWNQEWKLERAGFGGAGGGMAGIRGNTYLNGDVLATYPRDEIRGLMLTRTATLTTEKELHFEAGVDSGRAWKLDVFINNDKQFTKLVEGKENALTWETVKVDVSAYQRKPVVIRLYQTVLIPGKEAGNAYWKNLDLK